MSDGPADPRAEHVAAVDDVTPESELTAAVDPTGRTGIHATGPAPAAYLARSVRHASDGAPGVHRRDCPVAGGQAFRQAAVAFGAALGLAATRWLIAPSSN